MARKRVKTTPDFIATNATSVNKARRDQAKVDANSRAAFAYGERLKKQKRAKRALKYHNAVRAAFGKPPRRF